MSLHDVDKTSNNRITPRVNAPDPVTERMSHNTYSNTYRSSDGAVTQRMVFKNGLILTYDQDNKCSSVFGYIPEVSTIPFYLSAKEGYDVFTDILEITPPTV